MFEEYILHFDEPEKYILSEAKATDNKVENLKKIVNEAAKAMESESHDSRIPQGTSESQGPSEPQGPIEPTNDRTTFEGEMSSTPKQPDLPFQGEPISNKEPCKSNRGGEF